MFHAQREAGAGLSIVGAEGGGGVGKFEERLGLVRDAEAVWHTVRLEGSWWVVDGWRWMVGSG
jgi:hypothetical protein